MSWWQPGDTLTLGEEELVATISSEIPPDVWEEINRLQREKGLTDAGQNMLYAVGYVYEGHWSHYSDPPPCWYVTGSGRPYRDAYTCLVPKRLLHRVNEFGPISP